MSRFVQQEFIWPEDRVGQQAHDPTGTRPIAQPSGSDVAGTMALDELCPPSVGDAPPSNHSPDTTGMPSYDPGHPWYYYHEGDNAPPVPVDLIPANEHVGRHIEGALPKNPAKRRARMRDMLNEERRAVDEDKRRYQEIVERGAEALSRYDREIAHSSDEMARASSLALKYNHICFHLGRIAWLEKRLGVNSTSDQHPKS